MLMEPKLVTNYMHLHVGMGRVTLALRHKLCAAKGDEVEVGVAFCSPKDQFNKARGRNIARGRLEQAGNQTMAFQSNGEEPLKRQLYDIFFALMTQTPNKNQTVMHSVDIPRWANGAIARH
jgi:hypothetical protein